MRPLRVLKVALFAAAFGLVLAGWSTLAEAQSTGSVRGTITDRSTGRPLEGVQVNVIGTRIVAISDARGQYEFGGVPQGRATVRARLIGYATFTAELTVAPGVPLDLDFTMQESVISLDAVVVTGTGAAVEKKQLGNTIGTIDFAKIENAPVQSFSEAIAAREPSLSILPSSGIAGAGARIRIRGTNSLSMSNEPIVYIDGVRVDNAGGMDNVDAEAAGPSRLDDINPEAIDRIEVLKGAAAATLYGSEASSGVIQIFTKKGRTGAPRFNFRLEQGVSSYPDVFKPNAGFARSQAQADRLNEVFGAADPSWVDVAPYDVFERTMAKDMTETGRNQIYSASVSGGSDDFNYFVSGRFARENGPFGGEVLGPARDITRRAQGNFSFSVFPRDRLSFRVSGLFSDVQNQIPSNGNNIYGVMSLAQFAKPELAYCDDGDGDGTQDVAGLLGKSTPICEFSGNPTGQIAFSTVRETMQNTIQQDAEHFNGSITGTYQAMQDLNIEVTFGLDAVNSRSFDFAPFGHNVDNFTGNFVTGFRNLGARNHRELTLDAKGVWSTRFGNISSTLTAGVQGFVSRDRLSGGSGSDFPGPGLEVASAAATQTLDESALEKVNAGAYAQEQLGFSDFAYVTLGGRWDRNSAFGENAGAAFYPKAGISVVPSDLASWRMDMLSTFRVRAAIGVSGLQPGAFDRLTTFSAGPTSLGAGLQPDNIGNPDLKPEKSTEIEIGAEMGLFSDRVGIDITYWKRVTKDALIARQYPVSGGFTATQLSNIGQLDGKGVELKLDWLALDSRNLTVSLFANASYLKEIVTDMGVAPPIKVGGSYTRYRNFLTEGYAPGTYFGAKLVDYTPGTDTPYDKWHTANNAPGSDGVLDTEAELKSWLTSSASISASSLTPLRDQGCAGQDAFVDVSKFTSFCNPGDADDLDHYLGKPTPDWTGVFGTTVTLFGNLQVNTVLEYKFGNYFITNLTDEFRQFHSAIGRNTPQSARVEATLADPSTQTNPQARFDAAMEWAEELLGLFPYAGLHSHEKADFLRWRELSLSWTAPTSFSGRLGLNNMVVTLAGRNIATFTGYKGVDPEGNGIGRCGGNGEASRDCNFLDGIDAFGLPLPRRWSLSVQFGF